MKTETQRLRALAKRLQSKAGATAVALTNAYGHHAADTLVWKGVVVRDESASKGRRRAYRLATGAHLPSRDEFAALLRARYATTADALLTDAFGSIESLAEEARSIVDGAEGGLESTQRIQTLGDTADTLEELEYPELPACVAGVEVVHYPPTHGRTGRAARMAEVVDMLQTVVDAVNDWLEDNESHADRDDVEMAVSSIGELIDVAGGVEFPGMYS